MAINPHKQAAKKFVEYWTFNRPGCEKSGCQQYWNMLLGEVLGLRMTIPMIGDSDMSDGRDARPARPPLSRTQRKALLELQDDIASHMFIGPLTLGALSATTREGDLGLS